MKKRILLWAAALGAVTCIGCTDIKKHDRHEEESGETLQTLHLVMADTSVPEDEKLVEEAISAITRNKIHVNIDLHTITSGTNYSLYLGDSNPADLMAVTNASSTIRTLIWDGQLHPLNDLLDQYGIAIKRVEGNRLLIGEYEGRIYGISSNRQSGDLVGVKLLKSIVDKYAIDTAAIQSWDDLDNVFELVKTHEPNIQVVNSVGRSIAGYMVMRDSMGDVSSGVLEPDNKNSMKVINLYESQEWVQAVRRTRRWYEKGYIPEEILSSQANGSELQNEGKVFACVTMLNLDDHLEAGNEEKIAIPLSECLATTSVAQRIEWVIPKKSTMPEKAMEMLNLMYTEPEIINLLQYGIEGVHYTLNEDGTMVHEYDTTGKSRYYREFGQAGNQSLLHVASKLGTDYEIRRQEREEHTVYSQAYGFKFDKTNVLQETETIKAVINEYKAPLELGLVDPDTELPKFWEKLKEAGIGDAIQEKQRQLDEWTDKKQGS